MNKMKNEKMKNDRTSPRFAELVSRAPFMVIRRRCKKCAAIIAAAAIAASAAACAGRNDPAGTAVPSAGASAPASDSLAPSDSPAPSESLAPSDSQTPAPKAVYHSMSQEDAKRVMDGGDPYILVDVRTQAEYDVKHITGAVLIPVDEIENRAADELPDKDALIMVYCRSGVRSKNAAGILVGLGYTNVQDIGGIQTWPFDNVEGG